MSRIQEELMFRSDKPNDTRVSLFSRREEIERNVAEARAKMLQERRDAERARKQAEITHPLLRVPAPQPYYKDPLTTTKHVWPRRPDGLPLTGAQVAAKIRLDCDYLWHARAFGMRLLLQRPGPQPFPLRLKRVLYAAGSRACVDVSTAVRMRVSCGLVVRIAVGLDTVAGQQRQPARQPHDCAARVVEYVYGSCCRQVKVGRVACDLPVRAVNTLFAGFSSSND